MAGRLIKLNKDNNPGNAVWCDDHGRLECIRKRKHEAGRCHGPALRGLDICKIHTGPQKRSVRLIEGQARITAWSAVGEPPDGKNLDSGMAVLGMLQMSWLRAAAYGELLRRQVQDGGEVPNPEGLQAGDAVNGSGLIGYRFGAAGKDGHIYATNEEIRALVALESAERDRVVKYAKTAHDMGISSRITALAERWGDVVVGRIMLLLESLDLTPEQEAKVPTLIQAHLGSIEIGPGTGEKTS